MCLGDKYPFSRPIFENHSNYNGACSFLCLLVNSICSSSIIKSFLFLSGIGVTTIEVMKNGLEILTGHRSKNAAISNVCLSTLGNKTSPFHLIRNP